MYQNNHQIADYDDVLNYLFATNKNMTQAIDKLEDPDAWEQIKLNTQFDEQMNLDDQLDSITMENN